MSSRFKGLLGSKRKSAVNIQTSSSSPGPVGSPNGSTSTAATPPPGPQNSSQTSLPPSMSSQQLGRPPSYQYNTAAGRPTSPMPPGQPPATQQMAHHPAPIDTRQSYPGQNPQQMGPPQPPGYGGAYGQIQQQGGIQFMNAQHVAGRPAEVEGAGRSKAQLIVGIDFVRHLHPITIATTFTDYTREQPSPAWHLPLRPIQRPKKTSLLSGLVRAIKRNRRCAARLRPPTSSLCQSKRLTSSIDPHSPLL